MIDSDIESVGVKFRNRRRAFNAKQYFDLFPAHNSRCRFSLDTSKSTCRLNRRRNQFNQPCRPLNRMDPLPAGQEI